MVGLSGAFGVICLCLYFWKTQMLALLLGPQFHLFVVGSGFALIILAVVRGVTLWIQAGQAHAHHHEHHHDEGAGHEHAHAGHHHHHDDHGPEDHDHGWAPWRYVVLLVPVILFMLGLPNKGPEVKAMQVAVDYTPEATGYARLIALGHSPLSMMSLQAALHQDAPQGEAQPVDFKTLEGAASSPDRRSFWKDKTVEVRGQYSPDPRNERVFSLVRFRIQCCAADSIQLNVPILCKEPVKNIARESWVKVAGKVGFTERNGSYSTVVMVPSRSKIEACTPDLNPWIQ
jgi:hypothetical protein